MHAKRLRNLRYGDIQDAQKAVFQEEAYMQSDIPYTPSAIEAETIFLVGDFNDWDEEATLMDKLKDGRFKMVLDLEKIGNTNFGI
ncbi:MAG: hypothetical protein Q9P01_12840 [Anaerolineae bacterium]|nr:hypothetical protein [Anaerolineae bacterium]